MSDTINVDQYKRELRKSSIEEAFAGQLRALFMHEDWEQVGIQREFEFDWWGKRKWQADFAIDIPVATVQEPPEYIWEDTSEILLIEIEGGVIRDKHGNYYTRGRHVWGKGYRDDIDKYNYAALHGYTVLRFTKDMIDDGIAIETVRRALTGETP